MKAKSILTLFTQRSSVFASRRAMVAILLALVVVVATVSPVLAGSNGQQLKIYYNKSGDCPVRVTVRGPKQNSMYAIWSTTNVSCGDLYTQTIGWWWKGNVLVEVTYRRPNGTTYAVGIVRWIPAQYGFDYYKVCMPNAYCPTN